MRILGGILLVMVLILVTAVPVLADSNEVIAPVPPTLAAEPAEVPPLPVLGDANGDRVVDMADYTRLERILLLLSAPTPGADANGDGTLNVADLGWLERQILGLLPIYGDADGDFAVTPADEEAIMMMLLGLIPETAGADATGDGALNMGDVIAVERMLFLN